ncbi:histidine phosphatase family protein [Yoonia vestfoldensis]|jgi:broad specificity phosphatase PhoE|uniref:Phosphoserine phosphatase 1 n=1 Tax=Yoonia vestfoldensis TaxID=245188 RepID=A0A1Y0EFH0_9RHOB|nr:histidine phosphatase family protein [Yoonia vestfoldensis]ARU02052.1 phosphoserine phosphatase 1 [Yoonia vestfoldensis]
MTRLWWVRHAPTHEKSFVGWRDVPADLSDTALIGRVADHLPGDAVIVASDLQRASATADAIGRGRARLPDLPHLREMDFGLWDGMDWRAVAARDPDLSRRFWEEPGDLRAPEGESWNDVSARVAGVVDDLTMRFAGRDIVLVAHMGVIMTQIQRASGSTAYQALGHQIDNLSVTRMARDSTGWTLGAVNHLP